MPETGMAVYRVQKTVEEAAFSRLHQIIDGLDYWEVFLWAHRSSADIDSGGSTTVVFPYDFDGIIRIERDLSDLFPDDPAQMIFPEQLWHSMVEIGARQFTST
jgi:hypothetical protein